MKPPQTEQKHAAAVADLGNIARQSFKFQVSSFK